VQRNGIYWLPRFSVALERAGGAVEWIDVDITGERTPLPAVSNVERLRLDPAEHYLLSGPRTIEATDS
jgi:hypothetical protein